MLATIEEIIKRAGGARPSGVTKNLILNNSVPGIWRVRNQEVTITLVAEEGERRGCIRTKELGEWKPIEQFELPEAP